MGSGGTAPFVFNLDVSAVSSRKSPSPAPFGGWVVGDVELRWTLITILLPLLEMEPRFVINYVVYALY